MAIIEFHVENTMQKKVIINSVPKNIRQSVLHTTHTVLHALYLICSETLRYGVLVTTSEVANGVRWHVLPDGYNPRVESMVVQLDGARSSGDMCEAGGLGV